MATSYILIGWNSEKIEDNKKANLAYQNAIPILEKLCEKTPIPQYTTQLERVNNAIKRTEHKK